MKNPVFRADPGKEGEGQAAHVAACATRERQGQSDLPFFGVSRALSYIWKKRYEKHGVPERACPDCNRNGKRRRPQREGRPWSYSH
jgi:hypothetical protein